MYFAASSQNSISIVGALPCIIPDSIEHRNSALKHKRQSYVRLETSIKSSLLCCGCLQGSTGYGVEITVSTRGFHAYPVYIYETNLCCGRASWAVSHACQERLIRWRAITTRTLRSLAMINVSWVESNTCIHSRQHLKRNRRNLAAGLFGKTSEVNVALRKQQRRYAAVPRPLEECRVYG